MAFRSGPFRPAVDGVLSIRALVGRAEDVALSGDGDLSLAHETLTREPPRRLQQAENENGWEWAKLTYGSGLLGALEAAFQVRNNIAHGGKYFDREPMLVVRADELVRAAIVIVFAAAECDDEVNATFTGKE